MSTKILQQIEERLGRLEEELGQLKAQVAATKGAEQPWWERTAGIFEGNKMFDRIVQDMEKRRRAERRAAHHGTVGTRGRKTRQTQREG